MAKLIYANTGVAVDVKPANNEYFVLQELYAMLDCTLISVIPLQDGQLMIIDENGKLKRKQEVNSIATRYLEDAGGIKGDYIVGNALICNSKEFR